MYQQNSSFMDPDNTGCGGALWGLFLMVVIVAMIICGAGIVLYGGATALESARAERARADAERIAERARADVAVIEAKTAREQEANIHRETMFQLWSLALLQVQRPIANNIASVAVGIIGGIVGGVFLIRFIRRYEIF